MWNDVVECCMSAFSIVFDARILRKTESTTAGGSRQPGPAQLSVVRLCQTWLGPGVSLQDSQGLAKRMGDELWVALLQRFLGTTTNQNPQEGCASFAGQVHDEHNLQRRCSAFSKVSPDMGQTPRRTPLSRGNAWFCLRFLKVKGL